MSEVEVSLCPRIFLCVYKYEERKRNENTLTYTSIVWAEGHERDAFMPRITLACDSSKYPSFNIRGSRGSSVGKLVFVDELTERVSSWCFQELSCLHS